MPSTCSTQWKSLLPQNRHGNQRNLLLDGVGYLKQNSSILFQGEICGLRFSALMPKEPVSRVAYSLAEFAALFGKEKTWAYRKIYAQQVKAIKDQGRLMIPAAEVERILGTAANYNGVERKRVPKPSKGDLWRLYLAGNNAGGGNSGRRKRSDSLARTLQQRNGRKAETGIKQLPRKERS
jgi:hypothetical protein